MKPKSINTPKILTNQKILKYQKYWVYALTMIVLLCVLTINKLSQADDATEPITSQSGRVGFCATFTGVNIEKLYWCKMDSTALYFLIKSCEKDPMFMLEMKTPRGEQRYQDALSEYSRVQPCYNNLTRQN